MVFVVLGSVVAARRRPPLRRWLAASALALTAGVAAWAVLELLTPAELRRIGAYYRDGQYAGLGDSLAALPSHLGEGLSGFGDVLFGYATPALALLAAYGLVRCVQRRPDVALLLAACAVRAGGGQRAGSLSALTERLFYEVQMTFFLAGQIDAPTGSRLDVSLRNAQIEAFVLHLRQLVEFFWSDPGRRRDERHAFAADYFSDGDWARHRPAMPAILGKALLGGDDARLAYDRAWIRPADRLWDVVPQAFALAPVVMRFADAVDHEQFAPGYVHGMRLCAEMFVNGERGVSGAIAA